MTGEFAEIEGVPAFRSLKLISLDSSLLVVAATARGALVKSQDKSDKRRKKRFSLDETSDDVTLHCFIAARYVSSAHLSCQSVLL
jgi:hypothetical protein